MSDTESYVIEQTALNKDLTRPTESMLANHAGMLSLFSTRPTPIIIAPSQVLCSKLYPTPAYWRCATASSLCAGVQNRRATMPPVTGANHMAKA